MCYVCFHTNTCYGINSTQQFLKLRLVFTVKLNLTQFKDFFVLFLILNVVKFGFKLKKINSVNMK